MINKSILLIFISCASFFCIAQTNELPDSPLKKYDFNSDNWLLLYTFLTIDSVKFDKKNKELIQAIDNEKILDSLKSEFTCDLNKLIDGYKVYIITLIQNNEEKEYLVWDDSNNLDLGKLSYYLKPAIHHYFQTDNLSKLNKKIKKWRDKKWFIQTNKDSRKEGDYYVSAYEIKK